MADRPGFKLYLITDRTQTRGRPLDAAVREALEGGVRAVQLRERDLPARELLEWARRLRVLTREFGAKLFINDRLDICLAAGADGIHLRSDSLPTSVVRRLAGPHLLIGRSTHGAEEVAEAENEGADFVVLGPIYDTPSKRSYGSALGLEELRRAVSGSGLPVFALGGIRAERIDEVYRNGAGGVATVSGLLSVKNIKETAEHWTEEVQRCARGRDRLTSVSHRLEGY